MYFLDLFPTVPKFITKLGVSKSKVIIGVAKLKNQIYVVYGSHDCEILVYEDQTPFHILKKIKLNEIYKPDDVASCNKEDCLYLTDSYGECVWKIRRKRNDNRLIADEWLTPIGQPYTLSVNGDGQLLMVKQERPFRLEMHDRDCRLLLVVLLPKDIHLPWHAVYKDTQWQFYYSL